MFQFQTASSTLLLLSRQDEGKTITSVPARALVELVKIILL